MLKLPDVTLNSTTPHLDSQEANNRSLLSPISSAQTAIRNNIPADPSQINSREITVLSREDMSETTAATSNVGIKTLQPLDHHQAEAAYAAILSRAQGFAQTTNRDIRDLMNDINAVNSIKDDKGSPINVSCVALITTIINLITARKTERYTKETVELAVKSGLLKYFHTPSIKMSPTSSQTIAPSDKAKEWAKKIHKTILTGDENKLATVLRDLRKQDRERDLKKQNREQLKPALMYHISKSVYSDALGSTISSSHLNMSQKIKIIEVLAKYGAQFNNYKPGTEEICPSTMSPLDLAIDVCLPRRGKGVSFQDALLIQTLVGCGAKAGNKELKKCLEEIKNLRARVPELDPKTEKSSTVSFSDNRDHLIMTMRSLGQLFHEEEYSIDVLKLAYELGYLEELCGHHEVVAPRTVADEVVIKLGSPLGLKIREDHISPSSSNALNPNTDVQNAPNPNTDVHDASNSNTSVQNAPNPNTSIHDAIL
jgi:hypothetical protein